MQVYTYMGPYERMYPDILTPAGSLVVSPGDTHEFDEPPDGRWMAVEEDAAENESPELVVKQPSPVERGPE